MASHKQSFQCFDTIMDDPPLKPPFPHGHCSATSIRGSSGSTKLEPLEDRGCYLCADHQPVKMMASEASGSYSNPWYHLKTHPHAQQYMNRRPNRPEEAPGQGEDHHLHHHHRRSRKIVLVKNSDPSVRRTIVLHRRSLRSLALFMDEVSELMHCLIRKLYTLEGYKIDSVQSLLQCPSILVCVGREPFHPLLLDSFRKNSYDKLPRLNTKSRSSVCSDEKSAKKNVNFGLETKRSVIHPRCDSSNRSAGLSVSSEKLFPNHLNSLPPGHRGDCPHAGENIMDDDIEKRVLVNKDGSLSMEMKVRFRLLHNETLHWSTEVKKSKSTFNESHIAPDDACSLSHGSAESCSESDTLSASEADETYNTKHYQRHFEESHCQHCCAHCQEYDIWKNPVPPDQGSVRRVRSSSSSASSRRIVCKKASTDSMHTMSSEEYIEHVLEKATCIQQTFGQEGDTTIEQCTINHCCSRSEVSSMSPKPKSTNTVEGKSENTHASDNDENRPDVISSNLPKDQLSVQIIQPEVEEERSVSVVSSSSQILASLKEDQDDEDVNLTLSISKASNDQQEDEESKDAEPNSCSASPCKSPASLVHLSPKPPSKSSGRSKRSRKLVSPEVGDEEVRSEASISPKALSGPRTCKCAVSKDIASPEASEAIDQVEDIQPRDAETEERAISATSTKSLSEIFSIENGNAGESTGVNSEIIEERSSSATSIKSSISGKSNKANVSEVLESDKSRKNKISDETEVNSEIRTLSAMSVRSNASVRSRVSDTSFNELTKLQDSVEERAISAVSSKSNISAKSSRSKEPLSAPDGASEEGKFKEKALSVKSGTSNKSEIKELTNEDEKEERAPSSISLKSNISGRSKMSLELSELEDYEQDRAPSSISIKSNFSQKSKSDISEAASFQEGEECLNSLNTSVKLNTPEAEAAPQVELPRERSPSSVSSKSNVSARTRTSKISQIDQDEAQEKENVQERASSIVSVKSTASARSRKSETTPIPRSGKEIKERPPSVISVKSNASLKSNKSKMEEEEETENRASSVLSVKSEVSVLSNKSNISDLEQLEKRPSSAISAKSTLSVRSKGSKMSEVAVDDQSSAVYAASHSSETSNECSTALEETCKSKEISPDKEDRSPSVLSTKSNTSAKSSKSKVSEDRDDLRSASAMSSKSNVSTKSVKSVVSELVKEDQAEKMEQAEERALSAMSSKSKASERSKKSKHLKVPGALPQGAEHQTEERAQSTLSARSSISTRSNKSKISEVLTDELVNAKNQEEERASSALSAKSNISTKSKKSNASATDINTDDEERDRVPSAMSGRSGISTKTSMSAKSKASKISEVEPDDEESEVKAPSVAKSSISVRSSGSKHPEEEEVQNLDRPPSAISVLSEATPDENENTNVEEIQERALSVLSAKSSVSAKSKKSNASATNAYTDDKEKGERVLSAMSGRSGMSTKTSISAKSKTSKVSVVEPDDEESELKAPSVTKSSISVKSYKSNHSEEEEHQKLDRASSAISVVSEAIPDENKITNEGEIQERAPSALSAKSKSSVRSRTSKVSETIKDEPDELKLERALSSRSLISDVSGRSGPEDCEEKQKEVRTASALSSISTVSARTNKSDKSELTCNLEQRAPSKASITSGRSKRSNISGVAPKETKNTDTEVVWASSAMSSKSCASEISKHSERTAEEDTETNKVVERTSSFLSVKSTPSTTSDASVKSNVAPTKSNASAKSLLSEAEEPDRRSPSVVSNASAESKVSKAGVDKPSRSPSKLSVKSNVSTRSKKSTVSEVEVLIPTNTVRIESNRDGSPASDNSKVSQAENLNKCICGALKKSTSPTVLSETDSDHEVPESPLSYKSAKSKISSAETGSERVLTPTSTSVSIGIVEDHEADEADEEMDVGAVSMNSRTPASSKTELCGKSDQCLSESPVQITNEATPTPEEKPKSIASAKSNVSGKSKCSHCGSTCPTDTNQDRDDVASNKSSKQKYLITDGQQSASNSVRQSSSTQEILDRPSSKASGMSVHAEVTGQERTESPDGTHNSQSVYSKSSSTQQKIKISPVSSASAISDSKSKTENTTGKTERPKSDISRSSSHLIVNGQNNDVEAADGSGRSSKLSSKSTQKIEDNTSRCYSATSGNQLSPRPPKSPRKSKKPVILLGGSNDSVLLQTVPAPNPREEHTDHLNAEAEKTQSCRSDTNVSDIRSEKSSKCRKRIGSDSSFHKVDDDMTELSPSFLPNASPTEVVNEWLRKIPSDTALCDLGDEFHDNCESIEPLCTSHVPLGDENEHDNLKAIDVTKPETQNEMGDAHVVNAEGATDKKSSAVAEGDRSQEPSNEPKMFDSTVLVMKVLLSPRLDRCNSLPEVSPVYGRKLSASAQGLLDCLANLQLLDYGPSDEDGKKDKYQELMSMLKSLWLCDPKDSEKASEERSKHLEQEFKARSSSGVDVNSGSTGSGKSSVNDGTQVHINTECEGLDTLTKVQEVDEIVEEEASETPESKYDSATTDISQTQWTPETKDINEEKLKDDIPGSDETIRNNDSPRELIETPLSSNKSSGNNPRKEETESDLQEDVSSGSAPTQRSQLSKRLSQDPDPVWVLNLLNKLEKQFMTHYVDAMAEFKVRWNLDDNDQLDTMICELQDEVRTRIQSSIDRELKKIHGRAGRPRPPKGTVSRESTVQTEQRRRRLKVMRNQSIDPQPAKSDDEYTMTGTDFSDQRSDDEYCPCDSCLKKKMASKHVLPVELLSSAPVMMDFDLRKILQMKKSPPTDEKIVETASQPGKIEGENVGLEAVKEEDEKEGTDKETHASINQETEEDGKKESEEGDKEDNDSISYEEDSSENQSNITSHFRKDVDEAGEIDEMSDNMMTSQCKVERDEDQEENDSDSDLVTLESASSSKINNELGEDVVNDEISEFDDIMQAETAKEEASEGHAEEESEEPEQYVDNETAEEGHTEKTESVEEDETTGEDTVEDRQTAESLAAGEDDTVEDGEIANDNTEKVREMAESETADDGQTAKAETKEKRTSEEEAASKKESTGNTDEETAEEGDTADDETAEDGGTAEGESEDGQTDKAETSRDGASASEDEQSTDAETAGEDKKNEDETGEGGETVEDKTSEDGQTSEDEGAEEVETVEDKTSEDGQTAEKEASEEVETVEDKSSEDEQTADGESAEDVETVEDKSSEDGQTAEDEAAVEVETVEGKTSEDGQTAEDETGEEGETVEDKTSEDGQTAEDETGEEGETVEDKTSEDGQTAEAETDGEVEITEDDAAEEDKTSDKNESVEDGETAEGESAEESNTGNEETEENFETVNDDTAEEYETVKNESLEDGQTAGAETGGASDTGDEDSMKESETAGDETTENGQTAEAESGEESETAEDEADRDTAAGTSFEERETDEQRADEEETRDNVDDVSAEEKETSEAETADEGTTEAEMSEEKAPVEDIELAEHETPDYEKTGEETDKSQSDIEDDKETIGCEAVMEGDIISNPEDNLDVVEDETPLKNKDDVVLDSVDIDEESGKEDDDKGGVVANIGESAEAGDEAEDDTEPDPETDEGEHDGNTPALKPILQPKQKDDKPDVETSLNVLLKPNSESEDGADADGEDSETEEHNQVVDLSSEPQRKTPRKTFKVLVQTIAFLKVAAAGQPKSREEDNEHEVDDKETPEDGSEDAQESSSVEKDEVEELNTNEEGKLSDITEDTAEEEEDQTNETKDGSEDSEWESSENALQKQITKSSLESQPGSFEEVHEDQTKNEKGSNHLKGMK